MSAVWLTAAAAPCVMADAPRCNGVPCHDHGMADAQAMAMDCETLQALDCQRGDTNLIDRVTANDLPIPHPPAISTVSLLSLHHRKQPEPNRLRLRLDPPPLYLRHATLLI